MVQVEPALAVVGAKLLGAFVIVAAQLQHGEVVDAFVVGHRQVDERIGGLFVAEGGAVGVVAPHIVGEGHRGGRRRPHDEALVHVECARGRLGAA